MSSLSGNIEHRKRRYSLQHPFSQTAYKFLYLVLFSLLLSVTTLSAQAQEKRDDIRIAIGDIPGIDMLLIEAAAARARERDVAITISYMQSEDLATQAIINGLADIGIGTPYALIQKTNAPLRLFYQLSKLRFFPVVNTQHYDSWKALDGVPMFTHGKGSGTEAIMQLMAKKHGINYSSMTYVPGSGVRADAMIRGRFHATIVDTERRNKLLNHPSGKFAVLPIPEVHASDEALYGHKNILVTHKKQIGILVEELLNVSRMTNRDPATVVRLRDQYKLLPRSMRNKEEAILATYKELVSVDAIPANGGHEAVGADFEFYTASGTLEGQAADLKIEDFWELAPLMSALEAVGVE